MGKNSGEGARKRGSAVCVDLHAHADLLHTFRDGRKRCLGVGEIRPEGVFEP